MNQNSTISDVVDKKKLLKKGKELLQSQEYTQAELLFKSRSSLISGDEHLCTLLVLSLLKQDKDQEAYHYLQEFLKSKPDSPLCQRELGRIFLRGKNYKLAISWLQKAARLNPDDFETYNLLGQSLFLSKKYSAARKAYLIAKQLRPDIPETYLKIGFILEEQKDFVSAERIYKELLEKYPRYLEAYNKLGLLYKQVGKLETAESIFRQGIQLDPGFIRFYGNLGNVLQKQGKYQAALIQYEKALKEKPDYHEALFSRGLIHLLHGDFEKGWRDYEHRWHLQEAQEFAVEGPLWKGNRLPKASLLVWAEQGFGDTIQFSRYLPWVGPKVGQLTLACHRSLHRLFESVQGVDKIIDIDNHSQFPFDYQIPLMSLPKNFKSNRDSIPNKTPYLEAPKKAYQKIVPRINTSKDRFNIGIVWAGNIKNTNDYNRSCKLEHFELLDNVKGVQLYSIQKGAAVQDLRERSFSNIIDLDDLISDFGDTAAIINQLDLIITVDTAVAHLAGALDKPVWTLIPFYPDWRWMLDREDSPWYPSMRLFRQSSPGNWKVVFQKVRSELNRELKKQTSFRLEELTELEKMIQRGALKPAETALCQYLEKNKKTAHAHYLLSLIKHQYQDFPRALKCIKLAVELDPQNVDYLIRLGHYYFDLGQIDKAEHTFLKVLILDPGSYTAYLMIGKILETKQEGPQANFYFEKALECNREDWEPYYYLGKYHFFNKNMNEALHYLQKAGQQNPKYVNIHVLIGLSYKYLKQYDKAIDQFKRALRLKPGSAEVYNNLANVYNHMGNIALAEENYLKSIQLNQDYYLSYFNLGRLYHKQNDLKRAASAYQKTLAIKPDFLGALNNYSSILVAKKELKKALRVALKAIKLYPQNPHINNTLGIIYNHMGHYQQAKAYYRKALTFKPNFIAAHSNLGSTYFNLRQFDKALTYGNKAIELDPQHAEAHWNRAITLLATGHFKEGWSEYEWRWEKDDFKKIKPNFSQPYWDGSQQKDKRLLVWTEQGYGDTIQFIRFVQLAREKVNRLFVLAPKPIVRLLKTVSGIDKVIPKQGALPDFDIHVPLLSLPALLNVTKKDIDVKTPYIRAPESPSMKALDKGNNGALLKVGIVWRGAEHHKNDRHRSCPVHHFKKLGEADNVVLYTLQKESDIKELSNLKNMIKIVDLRQLLKNFSDTAVIIEQLDLVVSVDTAVAHLAGALGKPVWILLPYNGDWRWMTEPEKTIWYPTARLFRQKELDDWDSVFDRVIIALKSTIMNKLKRSGKLNDKTEPNRAKE